MLGFPYMFPVDILRGTDGTVFFAASSSRLRKTIDTIVVLLLVELTRRQSSNNLHPVVLYEHFRGCKRTIYLFLEHLYLSVTDLQASTT